MKSSEQEQPSVKKFKIKKKKSKKKRATKWKGRREERKSNNLSKMRSEKKNVIFSNRSLEAGDRENLNTCLQATGVIFTERSKRCSPPIVDNTTLPGSNQTMGTKRKREENKGTDSSMRRGRTKRKKKRNSFNSRSEKNYDEGGLSKGANTAYEIHSRSDSVKSGKPRKSRRHKKRRKESGASNCKVIPEKGLGGKSAVDSLDSNSLCVIEPSVVPKAIRSARKKLLVLDLNGLLCDVVRGSLRTCKPHERVGKSAVFKRPFCNNFMKFCCEKFDIGIWSSKKKENVHRMVNFIMRDIRDNLLFCWDSSKCTYTGFKTLENRNKPLVLKQLKKLWDKEGGNLPWEDGDYSPSNTLLLDDSPYKALCNPPHTGVFPYPYSYMDDNDNSLGPEGDIRVYLEGLALADDVQCYVREHPFGRRAITTANPSWKYYEQVIEKINKRSVTAR